jgi:hypothetical protein
MSLTLSSRLKRATQSPTLGASAVCVLSRVTNSPSPAVPFCISAVTSIQRASSFIVTGW